ncbi:unnamed protein product, partial [Prorocentrum cordatum]
MRVGLVGPGPIHLCDNLAHSRLLQESRNPNCHSLAGHLWFEEISARKHPNTDQIIQSCAGMCSTESVTSPANACLTQHPKTITTGPAKTSTAASHNHWMASARRQNSS